MASPMKSNTGSPTVQRELMPVTSLRGVGESVAARLEKLGVRTIQDLLFLLPLRYEDRTRITPIGAARIGMQAVVEGQIELTEVAFRGRRQLLCRMSDGSGSLTLRFFHFSQQQQQALSRGTRVRCFGEIRRGPMGIEIVHPEYRRITADTPLAADESLTPVYPATEGLTQTRLRQLTAAALAEVSRRGVPELLPPELIADLSLPSLAEALQRVHRPGPDEDIAQMLSGKHPAQQRLAFEELLAHHLSLRRLREQVQAEGGWPMPRNRAAVQALLAALPFGLTGAQRRAWLEIEQDLAESRPMLRLVQGDVGSGKTVVAALAAVHAVDAGFQAAVMAPTELLAEQHARNFARWLEGTPIHAELITGSQSAGARNAALARMAEGTSAIAIGTHALFQEHVQFRKLGIVIIDEQHRFGVHQRLLLQEKGAVAGRLPHQLVLTATPIPRTLAMTAYADLDVSVIDELPPGRTPVQTVAMPEQRRAEVVQHVDVACRQGRQVYWVCPLIEESEEADAQSAEEMAAQLKAALSHLRIGLVHGRLRPRDKERVMQQFKAGEIDLLVATTVIEVGVDVPNASLMVIENAERMGLSQLHQLRGRVGRGSAASSCVLLYKPPLGEISRQRLAVMRATNDGFEIARRDLELRGPGELLGTRQTGLAQMRVADLLRDAHLLPKVHKVAQQLQERHRDCIEPLLARWVGGSERFGKV
jgi:ATP-dependent DNA helicase RecG